MKVYVLSTSMPEGAFKTKKAAIKWAKDNRYTRDEDIFLRDKGEMSEYDLQLTELEIKE